MVRSRLNVLSPVYERIGKDHYGEFIKMKLLRLIVLAALLCVAGGTMAGQLEDAATAYGSGDYTTAVRLWRPLAEQGNAEAQNHLGVAYYWGRGVPADYAEAFTWFRLAAEQGLARAQGNLGTMYIRRLDGASGDIEQIFSNQLLAHMWFNLASAGGSNHTEKRQELEARMLPENVIRAQSMAKACLASNYKQCDMQVRLKPVITPSVATKSSPAPAPRKSKATFASALSIPLLQQGGTFTVPVQINGAITLNFVVDSGAADVSIPTDVVTTLMRTGTLKKSDFLGQKTYVLADGSKVPSQTFRIRSMKVGDRVVENITGSVSSADGVLLLGQSFLGRFKSWSIDNNKHVLLLE